VAISAAEIAYLCDAANRYFRRAIAPPDVVWAYSGVRPLLEEESVGPSAATRDYRLELDTPEGQAPLLSVFGGKITTFRKLGEEAVDLLAGPLGVHRPCTTRQPLPGGDLPRADFDAFLQAFQHGHPWLPPALAQRYAHAYGTRAGMLLGTAHSLAELGEELAPGLYAAELIYLQTHEWAQSADDVLWRRSKLGLHLPATAAAVIDAWFARHRAPAQTWQNDEAPRTGAPSDDRPNAPQNGPLPSAVDAETPGRRH
jgi:glycerol-3-phosphate dehydrogenase